MTKVSSLTRAEAAGAFRVGLARSFAELGLRPGEAETLLRAAPAGRLAKAAGDLGLDKLANGPTFFEQVMAPASAGVMGSLLVGGALGAASGHVRHALENEVNDVGDPELEELKKKNLGYQKMTRELQTAHAAGLSQ